MENIIKNTREDLLRKKFIKNRTSNVVFLQILFLLVVFLLRDIGTPSFILYITDILTILSIFYSIKKIGIEINRSKSKTQVLIIFLIVFFACFGAIIGQTNLLLFAWGARNNFRFFAFWLACITLLNENDVKNMFKLLKVFFWINFLISLVQYFAFNVSGDYLGGIFGISQGCNAYTNVFFCLIISLCLSEYINNKISLPKLISYIFASISVAALAELKILYVEFLIAFICALLAKKFTIKKLILSMVGVICIILGVAILIKIFPESLNLFFEKEAIDSYLSGNGYTNSGDLNRLTAISQIKEMFFGNGFILNLFGFGLGSCDTSSFFSSEFYMKYSDLHYRWFSHAWVYLEQGAIGLILLFVFFISIVIFCLKDRKKNDFNGYRTAALIFTILTIIGINYNCTLEIEACYFVAFMCATPFVIKKRDYVKKV